MLRIFLFVLSLAIGYLLGSVPTGYLVAKARGVNIQKTGSGNIGATNVLRSVGPLAGLVVILADPLKGVLAVFIAIVLGLGEWGIALTGLAAILGNNFNIFLKLRGGKGIATSLGVFLLISPAATLGAVAIGLFAIALGRFVSLGSLVGGFSLPLLLIMGNFSLASLFLAIVIALLAIYRHKDNILRLAKGSERRLGEKRQEPAGKAGDRDA